VNEARRRWERASISSRPRVGARATRQLLDIPMLLVPEVLPIDFLSVLSEQFDDIEPAALVCV
jgi:hypothetical protein